MLLHKAVESKKFDVRVVDRNIERGLVRAEDADKVTKSLPDDAANAEWVRVDDLIGDEN